MDKKVKSLLRESARGSLILMISQLSSTVILAVGMLISARFLGSTKWGILNIANSVVSFGATFQNIKVRPGLVKHISNLRYEEDEGNIGSYVKVGVLLSMIASLIIFTIVFMSSDYLAVNYYKNPELGFYIKILSFSLFAKNMLTTVYGVVIGFERMEYYGIMQVVYSILKSLLTPLLVFFGFGLFGAVIGELGPVTITGIIATIILFKLINPSKGEKTISYLLIAKQLLRFGIPLYFSSLLLGIRPNLYTSLLGVHVSEEIVGNWSVVLWFSTLISFVNAPISNALFPLFSKLDNNQDLEFVYKIGVKYSTLFVFPIIFTIMSLSDNIFAVLFPGDYVLAPTFLRYYMITFLYIGLGLTCNGSLLNGRGLTNSVFTANLIQFIITVPFSFYIIPNFGVNGIIFLLLIGTLLSQIYNLYTIKNSFGFSFNIKESSKIFFAGIFSYIITSYFINIIDFHPLFELILGGLLSLSSYMFGILLFKVINKGDIEYVNELSESFGPLSPIFKTFINLIERRL
jgi:stage V sporulation protein B